MLKPYTNINNRLKLQNQTGRVFDLQEGQKLGEQLTAITDGEFDKEVCRSRNDFFRVLWTVADPDQCHNSTDMQIIRTCPKLECQGEKPVATTHLKKSCFARTPELGFNVYLRNKTEDRNKVFR